ncbi:MAG: ASCH domain-containing protein [Acidimicrobiia bacterium]|nr:ASCH domain-containing protein [Acidimicrobiia bacterium]
MPSDGLPTLTIHQPYPTLIMLGTKTIETRGWRAPERLIGSRIGIHASAKIAPEWSGWLNSFCDDDGGRINLLDSLGFTVDEDVHGSGYYRLWKRSVPTSALLGTVRLDACVQMVGMGDPDPGGPQLVIDYEGELWLYDDVESPRDLITDQRPYGDFRPGMWAWLLSDPVPTADRCPRCDGAGIVLKQTAVYFNNRHPCPVCDGAGSCPPIPAKGRQRVWYWTPEKAA